MTSERILTCVCCKTGNRGVQEEEQHGMGQELTCLCGLRQMTGADAGDVT